MTDELTPDQIEEMRFRTQLERSHKASVAVAQFLQRRGWQTEVPETRIRPRFEDRKAYGDKGDVFMWKDDVPRRICEVKWRSFDFTCEDNFPYPSIIIDRATKEGGVISDLYFNVSRALTHSAIVVTAVSKKFWRTVTIFDRKKGYEATNFECPKQHADFVQLSQQPAVTESDNDLCHCGARSTYGYKRADGLIWYCADHRLGQWWADARRWR